MPGPLIGLGMGTMGAGIGAATGAAATGAAGAGAAAGIAGIPWAVIIPIVMSLLGDIFKKKEDPLEKAQDLKRQMGIMGLEAPYQSPYLPQMDEAAFRAVTGQLGRTRGWGWPEGMGGDMSWLEDMIANIEPASAFQGVRGVTRGLRP